MKRFSVLCLTLLVLLVAAAAASQLAFAVQPSNLPTGVKAYTGNSEGAIVLHNASGRIECKAAAFEGSEETSNEPPSGPVHIVFKECKNIETGITCTGLGDASGLILLLGTTKLVFDRKVGGAFTELTTGVLFLINTVHYQCSALLLVELKGEFLCLDLKPTEANTIHSIHCTGEEVGGHLTSNEEWCKGGDVSNVCVEPTKPKLEGSVNHAAFAEELILGLVNMKFAVAITGMI